MQINFGHLPDDEKKRYKALLDVVGGLIGAKTPLQDDAIVPMTRALAMSFQDDLQGRLGMNSEAIIHANFSKENISTTLFIVISNLVMASSMIDQTMLRNVLKQVLVNLDKIEELGDMMLFSLGGSLQIHKAKEGAALH